MLLSIIEFEKRFVMAGAIPRTENWLNCSRNDSGYVLRLNRCEVLS
jgi:hypothetical protein